jgi:plasmid replication initiation protein
MNDLSGELEVWQSNRLVEAAQTLTLNEKRLVIAAAALHDPRKPLPSKGTVTLHAEDFADVFGIESRGHVYEALEDASRRLGNRWIRTIYNRKGKQAERNVRWVWLVEYRKGEGTVVLGFSPGVAPYLTQLHTEFTRYKLKQIGNIGSFYGLRLYELCAQFRKGGERTIPLARLREMLDLGDKYADIKNLRVRVLDPGLKEINQHTDLRVVMTPERKGRKVVGFHFDITQDDQIPLDLPAPEEGDP